MRKILKSQEFIKLQYNRVGTTRINACGDRIQPTDFGTFSWLSLKQETSSLKLE
ncbi:MAG: hypothetical protein KC589_02700 [Nanoarchaeota archaeon]|nr:hypothetical protein [Nanoarchaeota archaeon]